MADQPAADGPAAASAPTPQAAGGGSGQVVRDADDQAIIDLASQERTRDFRYHSRRRRVLARLSSLSYWLSLLLSVVSSVLAYIAGAQAGREGEGEGGASTAKLALTAGGLGTLSASLNGASGAFQSQSDRSTQKLQQMMREAGDDDILHPLLANSNSASGGGDGGGE